MKRLLIALLLLVGCEQQNVPAQVITIERYTSIDTGAGGAEVTVKLLDKNGTILRYRNDNATPINNAQLKVGDKLWLDLLDGRIRSLGEKTTSVEGGEAPQ